MVTSCGYSFFLTLLYDPGLLAMPTHSVWVCLHCDEPSLLISTKFEALTSGLSYLDDYMIWMLAGRSSVGYHIRDDFDAY